MSNVLQDPPAEWLEANGFIPDGFPCLKEDARQALRMMYQRALEREALVPIDHIPDLPDPIDAPAPDTFGDILPDYSELLPGVEPGCIQEVEYHRYMDNYHGLNQSPNSEIAA